MATTRRMALGRTVFLILTCCALLAAAAPAEPVGYTYWQYDPATPGDWLGDANWTHGLPGPFDCAILVAGKHTAAATMV